MNSIENVLKQLPGTYTDISKEGDADYLGILTKKEVKTLGLDTNKIWNDDWNIAENELDKLEWIYSINLKPARVNRVYLSSADGELFDNNGNLIIWIGLEM